MTAPGWQGACITHEGERVNLRYRKGDLWIAHVCDSAGRVIEPVEVRVLRAEDVPVWVREWRGRGC